MIVLVFAGVVLVDLVTILGVVFRVAVPYWRNNHCLNVSMVMLLFIIVGLIVTYLESTVIARWKFLMKITESASKN